jgi:hypothetical protein
MSMDLSEAHAPVRQFLEHPKDLEAWQNFRLTEEQIAGFHTQGYVPECRFLTTGN